MGRTKLTTNTGESPGESQELLREESSEYRELGESQELDGESAADKRSERGFSVKESIASWRTGTLSFLKTSDNDVLDEECCNARLRRLLDEAVDIERLSDPVAELETADSNEDRRPLKLSRRYGKKICIGSID